MRYQRKTKRKQHYFGTGKSMTRVGDRVVTADEEDRRSVSTRNLYRTCENSRSHANVWKTSPLAFGILLILYLTEINKIRKPYLGSPGSDAFGAKVEFKHPKPKPPFASNNDDMANKGEDISFDEPQKENKKGAESVKLLQTFDNTASITNPMTNRHTYTRRGQPMGEEDKKAMVEKWGSWTLIDKKKRPTEDYYANYSNRDIPRSDFPPNAWQIDNDYLGEFLPEAIKLIERTQEAILAEYGHTEGSEMFELEMFESLEEAGSYIIQKPEWRKDREGERGGWSTFKSIEGLKRRLLHAVMTEDTFIVAMGGHSSAAGHGNNFIQSYTVQVQWILEAVFARLGIRHVSQNFANGGLGTIQHGIAASSVYGPYIDMLIWDSGTSITPLL